MRTNVYSDELTSRIEIVEKKTAAGEFIGVRFFIYTPVTIRNQHGVASTFKGPFEKVEGDDDSSAVTFWAHAKSPDLLLKALRTAALKLNEAVSIAGG